VKRVCSYPAVLILLVMFLTLSTVALAQPRSQLQIATATMCREVVNRAPVDSGTQFPVSVGKLFCFTKVEGAQPPTKITHVWYQGDTERDRIDLTVNGPTWRTYSSKTIRAGDAGPWHVDVLDSAGTVVKTLQFEITP
jgi:hypothetical protein